MIMVIRPTAMKGQWKPKERTQEDKVKLILGIS